ncbi:hypothetical protein [Streptomyces sp. NPDC055036]
MGEFTACPREALRSAEARCGPVVLEEITDRRGSAVWKATGAVADAAIKYGCGEGAETTAREAAVLGRLPGRTVRTGRTAEGFWYVTPWLDGPSTFQVFRPVRRGSEHRTPDAARTQALAAAVHLSRAVADLHSAGWIHGDLQPSHGIHNEWGAALIDFAWSWQQGAGTPPWSTFHGGITHLIAPELAASITEGPQPVVPTASSDVYALAGVLWTCTTGKWPLDYAAAGIPLNVGPVNRRAAIATGKIPLSPAASWPVLQDLLRPVLLSGPADRPTAAELGTLVEGA